MNIKSIRAFIGAKDYQLSREFYKDWGFEELQISEKMSFFRMDQFGFYLQNYYAKEWVDNTMLFLEVDDLGSYWKELTQKGLDKKYGVKFVDPKNLDWGSEGFIYDPSGILWHVGEFNQ
ncbi:VOC family protein [Ekhidna sp.]